MAQETYQRGDFLAKRGVPYIDKNGDLCPSNMGGNPQVVGFSKVATTASLTGKVIAILGGNTTNSMGFIMPRVGSLLGIYVKLSTHATSNTGSASWWPTINGTTQTSLKLTQTGLVNVRAGGVFVAKDSLALVAGDEVGVKLTTNAGWLPANASAQVSVLLEF
jgi:hypothetical protein